MTTSQPGDKRLEARNRLRMDAVTDTWRINFAADQSGILEHLEVLGNGSLGEREPLDDEAALALSALHQQLQDLDASRVTQRLAESS